MVLGFLFDFNDVLLIEKARPNWQKGRLNGIGGHIEDGESPIQAMIREFKEETQYEFGNHWYNFGKMGCGTDWEVFLFSSISTSNFNELNDRVIGDETLKVCSKDNLPVTVLPNLEWLIPMAHNSYTNQFLNENIFYSRIEYKEQT